MSSLATETLEPKSPQIDSNGPWGKVRIAGKPSNQLWDLTCQDGYIGSISPHIDRAEESSFGGERKFPRTPFIIPSLW